LVSNLVQKVHSTVDAVVNLVEFLVCETQASGIADVEVGEDLKVDFGRERFEFWGRGGSVWVRASVLKLNMERRRQEEEGMMLTRHCCD
jgi:hypothetical protein